DQVTNFIVKIRMLRESYGYLVTANNPVPFRPGMSASVDIQTKRVYKVISIPIQAVTVRNADSLYTSKNENDNDNDVVIKNQAEEKEKQATIDKNTEYVFINNNSTSKKIEVTTGIQDNKYTTLILGIKI